MSNLEFTETQTQSRAPSSRVRLRVPARSHQDAVRRQGRGQRHPVPHEPLDGACTACSPPTCSSAPPPQPSIGIPALPFIPPSPPRRPPASAASSRSTHVRPTRPACRWLHPPPPLRQPSPPPRPRPRPAPAFPPAPSPSAPPAQHPSARWPSPTASACPARVRSNWRGTSRRRRRRCGPDR